MSVYSRVLRALGERSWFAAVASRTAPTLDRAVYRLTRGRRLATPTAVPTFFLTTIGRVTGAERRVAVSYLQDAGDFVVVGTNFGKSRSPDWALNLLANTQCWVEQGGTRARASASVIPDADRQDLWRRFAAMWPAYGAYRLRASSRPIHMFRLVLTPSAGQNLP